MSAGDGIVDSRVAATESAQFGGAPVTDSVSEAIAVEAIFVQQVSMVRVDDENIASVAGIGPNIGRVVQNPLP
jgi:hypothetical protein